MYKRSLHFRPEWRIYIETLSGVEIYLQYESISEVFRGGEDNYSSYVQAVCTSHGPPLVVLRVVGVEKSGSFSGQRRGPWAC